MNRDEPRRESPFSERAQRKLTLWWTLTLFVLAFPLFLNAYRTLAFNTMPTDNYEGLVMKMAGDLPQQISTSPYAYRVLSLAPTLPFYRFMPLIRFSQMDAGRFTDSRLRAMQAVSFVSYLCVVGGCVTLFALCLNRLKLSVIASLGASLAGLAIYSYTAVTGVDPTAMLVMFVALYFLETPAVVVPVLLISAAVNEKIPLLFLALFLGRYLADRKTGSQWRAAKVATALSFIGYVVAVKLLHYPGSEVQRSLSAFLPSVVKTVAMSFSGRGIALNLFPVVILVGLVVAGKTAREQGWGRPYLLRGDTLTLVATLLMALVADVQFNVGRIALYAFPFLLPAAVVGLERFGEDVQRKIQS